MRDEAGSVIRRLIDALSRNAPATEVQVLREALPEVYGRRHERAQQRLDPGAVRGENTSNAVDLDRIPDANQQVLHDAGFEWMPYSRVYYHRAIRALIPYEELIAAEAHDLTWLRERIAQALADDRRTS